MGSEREYGRGRSRRQYHTERYRRCREQEASSLNESEERSNVWEKRLKRLNPRRPCRATKRNTANAENGTRAGRIEREKRSAAGREKTTDAWNLFTTSVLYKAISQERDARMRQTEGGGMCGVVKRKRMKRASQDVGTADRDMA